MRYYARCRIALAALVGAVTRASVVMRAMEHLLAAIELAQTFGDVSYIEPPQPDDGDAQRSRIEARRAQLPGYLRNVQETADRYFECEQEFRDAIAAAKSAVNDAAIELDSPATPALDRKSIAIQRAVGQLSASVPNSMTSDWASAASCVVLDRIRRAVEGVYPWIQELRLLVEPEHALPPSSLAIDVSDKPAVHTRDASPRTMLSQEDVPLDPAEFDLFEQVRLLVIAPSSREGFRAAVAFIDEHYSDAATTAKAEPKGDPPPGHVRVDPDPANEPYRQLGSFVKDAITWDLSDSGDAERELRSKAIIYVAWLTSDPDAGGRGVELSTLERTPWHDPEMRVLGRWWVRMLAIGTKDDWRKRWLDRVRIALAIVVGRPRGDMGSADRERATGLPTPENIENADASGQRVTTGVFRREGSAWVIGLGDSSRSIAHLAGFTYIHALLRAAGDPVSVDSLISARKGLVPPPTASESVMDAEAVKRVATEMARLREEYELASAGGDDDRAAELQRRVDELEKHVSPHLDGAGKPRKVNPKTERLRKSVGAALTTALGRLKAHDEALHLHLEQSLIDLWGFAPRYKPSERVRWTLE